MPTLELIIDGKKARVGAAQFSAAVRQVEGSARRGAAATGKLNRGMRGLASTLGPLVAGFGALAVARKAVTTITQFESSMATLRGVAIRTNQTLEEQEAQYQKLEATARSLGASTAFSASQAAEGLLFLARAGFSVDEATTALPATLNLAQAGLLELGEAADIASNVLSQFGLSAVETENVVDVLVFTANRANTDVRQLAEAMKFAGPVAGALGISVDAAAAAIGVLGDAGIQGSLAGTNLRGVLSNLIDVSESGERAIEDLGLSLEDLQSNISRPTVLFEKFRDAGLGAEQALAIFGKRNAAAALQLSNAAEKMRELTESTEKNGESSRLAAIQAETLEKKFKGLQSALEELFLQGKGPLGAFLKDIVDGLTTITRALTGETGALFKLKFVFSQLQFLFDNLVDRIIVGFETAGQVILLPFRKLFEFIIDQVANLIDEVAGILENLEGVPLIGDRIGEGAAGLRSVAASTRSGAAAGGGPGLSEIALEAEKELARRINENRQAMIDRDRPVIQVQRQLEASRRESERIEKAITEQKAKQEALARKEAAETQRALQADIKRASKVADALDFEEEILADLRLRVQHLDKDQERRELIVEHARILREGEKRGIANAKAIADEYQTLVHTLRQGGSILTKHIEFHAEIDEAIERERSLIGLSNSEREVQLRVLEAVEEAKRRGLTLDETEIANIKKKNELLLKEEEQREVINDAVRAGAEVFANSIESLVFEFESLEQALEDFVKDLSRAIFRALVTQQITNAITSFATSSGGNQHGGILPGPSYYNFPGGAGVVAGETNRREAILPLARVGPDLGVLATGGGGGPQIGTINVNFPNVRDSEGLRRSKRQIARNTTSAIRRATS